MFDAVELVEACRKAAGVPVAACSEDDLLASVGALEAARRALEAAQCAVAAELEVRGVCDARFGHRTRDWLVADQRVERREAGRWCRVGRGLRCFAVVAEALAGGRLTLEHVRVLCDVANVRNRDGLAAAQEALVELAEQVSFAVWAEQVRDLAELADVDGGHDPSPERRSATTGRGLDGEWFLRATLLGDATVAAGLRNRPGARHELVLGRLAWTAAQVVQPTLFD